MGFLDDRWAETARLLVAQLQPHLAPGEELVGAVHATQSKTFSAQVFAVGITPSRLIVLPVDRRMQPKGQAPASITRDDIVASSVWGWGGSVRDWLSVSSDQQIRIETPTTKYRWMVVGGNVVENALAGDEHLRGLDALIEFVLSAKR